MLCGGDDWKTYILYGTIAEGLLLHVAYLVREHVLLQVALQERGREREREAEEELVLAEIDGSMKPLSNPQSVRN